MLAHSLHPMQPQGMQHSARALHNAQNGKGEEEPEVKGADRQDDTYNASHTKGNANRHVPEHDRELLMSEGKGPEPKVGCRVRDAV